VAARFAELHGTVDAFDDRAGAGQVRSDDGELVFFHCTRIADGSRTIPVGVDVTFTVAPIGLGTWEAVDVRPTSVG
jgi:cold shock CspA family protein